MAAEVQELRAQANEIFGVLPAAMPGAEKDTKPLVKLGQKIYFDKCLSANHQLSCNSCHAVNDGGAYPRGIPRGASGKHSERNSPTVWNAGFQFAQFWDGRANDLEAQAVEPMLNPDEMGMPSEKDLLTRMAKRWTYRRRFASAFPDQQDVISTRNVAGAVAAFERTLKTHDRFDDFLNGKDGALTHVEKQGLEKFLTTGCQQCHNGPGFGGNSYQKIGRFHPYETPDKGRAKVTGIESDLFKFKVPSLRNVALRSPYFHDGKIRTLGEAIRQMAYLQLDTRLSDADVEAITVFLNCLSDKKLAITKRQLSLRIQE